MESITNPEILPFLTGWSVFITSSSQDGTIKIIKTITIFFNISLLPNGLAPNPPPSTAAPH